MKSANIKKLFFLLLTLSLVFANTISFCVDPSQLSGDPNTKIGQNTYKVTNTIIGAMQIIGTAVAIIMLIWLAIKYLSAAPSEKADIKKSAVIYIVGAILLFGGVNLLAWFQSTANDITSSTEIIQKA